LKAAADVFASDPKAGNTYSLRGLAYTELGRYADAETSFRRNAQIGGGGCEVRSLLAHLHAVAGATDSARAFLRLCEDSATDFRGITTAHYIARVYAGLGDRDRAIEWLERTSKLGMHLNIAVDPAFSKLHDDRRFRAVVQLMGLPDSALTRPRLR
jgi:Flp pilus assembly protein TadD